MQKAARSAERAGTGSAPDARAPRGTALRSPPRGWIWGDGPVGASLAGRAHRQRCGGEPAPPHARLLLQEDKQASENACLLLGVKGSRVPRSFATDLLIALVTPPLVVRVRSDRHRKTRWTADAPSQNQTVPSTRQIPLGSGVRFHVQ